MDTQTKNKPESEPIPNPFTQLCVWEGVDLGDHSAADFERHISELFDGTRAKFAEVTTTLPTFKNGRKVKGTGNRTDLLFWVHSDDLPKFALKRLNYGIRWWEDVLGNGGDRLYFTEVLNRYPPIAWTTSS